jgi:chorismate dehydratase
MLSNVKIDTLRVGRVSFLNTLPFYFQMENFSLPIQWHQAAPSVLNHKMRCSDLDIALISSLEYAQSQDQYLVLAPICIGTKNQSDSVVLVSQKPLEALSGEHIVLPKESLSSSSLLQILLKQRYGFENTFQTGENQMEEIFKKSAAGLLIGDSALFQKKEAPFSYDLGVLWKEWKNKPFCFALWVVQKSVAQQFPEEVSRFKKILTQSLQYSLYHLDELIDLIRKERRFDEEQLQTLLDYYMHLNFFMDQEIIEGLMDFFSSAHEEGLAPACHQLHFFEGQS